MAWKDSERNWFAVVLAFFGAAKGCLWDWSSFREWDCEANDSSNPFFLGGEVVFFWNWILRTSHSRKHVFTVVSWFRCFEISALKGSEGRESEAGRNVFKKILCWNGCCFFDVNMMSIPFNSKTWILEGCFFCWNNPWMSIFQSALTSVWALMGDRRDVICMFLCMW